MRKRIAVLTSVIAGVIVAACVFTIASCQGESADTTQEAVVTLPPPKFESKMGVEEAIRRRRSVRSYADDALTLRQVSALLWAAQGITDTARGFRTAPSAGALYPLEVYLVAGNVKSLTAGVYRYKPGDNALVRAAKGDKRRDLFEAALSQEAILQAPASIVVAGVYARTSRKYGDRAARYVHIEVGHAGQNICLQAVALGLSTVTIGAFDDSRVKKLLNLAGDEAPLYIICVGKKK